MIFRRNDMFTRLAISTLFILTLPCTALACDMLKPDKFVAHIFSSVPGEPDVTKLKQLHLMDLNADNYLDAYVVTSFWVHGGADDAGALFYYKGTKDGICLEAYDMQLDAIGEVAVTVIPPKKAGGYPSFRAEYDASLGRIEAKGGGIIDNIVPRIDTFYFDAKKLFYVTKDRK